jgi:hypothetical protein
VLRRIVPAALLAAVLLAGCGGDDRPQTKEGFISAADGVCADASTDLANAGAANPQTPADIAKANAVLADIYGKLTDGISDVTLPASGPARRQAQMFVSAVKAADPPVEDLRSAAKRFEAAAKKQDKRAITAAGGAVRSALDAFRAARAQADRRAIAYGLQVCGNLG